MAITTAYLKWFLRVWPLVTVIAFSAVHFILHFSIEGDWTTARKVMSTVMQLCGGSIVVYSINSNIGTFRQSSLFNVFRNWMSERPGTRTVAVSGVSAIFEANDTISAFGTVNQTYVSIDEHLKDIERQLEETRSLLRAREAAINSRMDKMIADVTGSLESHGARLTDLTDRVTKRPSGWNNPTALRRIDSWLRDSSGVFHLRTDYD